jgi:hypothetical protein
MSEEVFRTKIRAVIAWLLNNKKNNSRGIK